MLEDTLSDKEVLKKSFQNPRYFSILVDRYQEAFLRKSLSITHRQEEAEDVVQETFIKIYRHGKKWREKEGASFKSWAYIILRNTCYSYYKKQKRYSLRIKSVDMREHEFEDEATIPIETREEKKSYIESILSLMPNKLSEILRLYFLEEKSQKEIAVIENLSIGAVRTRISRAKDYFRKLSTQNI